MKRRRFEMTPNLSLEFLAADLRIEGRLRGGGNITDAILVPEPSGQLGFMLAALASFSFWRSHRDQIYNCSSERMN